MVSQTHQSNEAQIEALKTTAINLVRDLNDIHHKHGSSDDPCAYIEKIFRRLEERNTFGIGSDSANTQWVQTLNACGSFDVWLGITALKAFLGYIQCVYYALGAQLFPKPLEHTVTTVKRLPKHEVVTAIRVIYQKLMRLRLPLHLRIDISTAAAVRLCQAWIEQNYFSYEANDPRKHDTASLMLIMESDLERELLPVMTVFSELEAKLAHQPGDGRKGYEWKEYAMIYLGNQRALQAWEILHTEDVVVRNHLLSDLAV